MVRRARGSSVRRATQPPLTHGYRHGWPVDRLGLPRRRLAYGRALAYDARTGNHAEPAGNKRLPCEVNQ